MRLRYASIVAGLLACSALYLPPAAQAQEVLSPGTPAISKEAAAALQQMDKTLLQQAFSFEAKTLRAYEGSSGDLLHIAHTINVIVRRPDRLSVEATGDDGTTKLVYDGKQVTLANANANKYAVVPAPGNLQAMMDNVMSRLNVDFPLADFLTNDPAKTFLTDVTSGKQINTVNIDGRPCTHFLFTQSGGINLELWLENYSAVPRRLIVTYYTLPGDPSFVAEFSDWNFGIRPSDAQFVYQPPPGAQRVELAAAAAQRIPSFGGSTPPGSMPSGSVSPGSVSPGSMSPSGGNQ